MSPIHYPAITRLQKYCCHYIPWHERETLIEKIVNNVRCIPSKTNYSNIFSSRTGLVLLNLATFQHCYGHNVTLKMETFSIFILSLPVLSLDLILFQIEIKSKRVKFIAYICVIQYQGYLDYFIHQRSVYAF